MYGLFDNQSIIVHRKVFQSDIKAVKPENLAVFTVAYKYGAETPIFMSFTNQPRIAHLGSV